MSETLTKPTVKPALVCDTWRQATIKGLSVAEITARIGFEPNEEGDPDKVVNEWGFSVNGRKCAVWDYAGSHLANRFSGFGPLDALIAVFGAEHVEAFK